MSAQSGQATIREQIEREYQKMLDGERYELVIQCCDKGAAFDDECDFWYCDGCDKRPDLCECNPTTTAPTSGQTAGREM